mgnify:CR=1 FL=1
MLPVLKSQYDAILNPLLEGQPNLKNAHPIREYNKLAKCTERRFYALNEGGKQYLIKILSVIGKSEKNVRQ